MPSRNNNLTGHFEIREGHAFAALVGRVSLVQAASAVTRALVAARDQGIKRLLVDATQLWGFSSPSVADRYFIVRRWASAAGNQVELSIVLEQHILDPDRFGMMVASNLGMRADAFNSPSEALSWLLSGQPSGVASLNQKPVPASKDKVLKSSGVPSDELRTGKNR